MGTDLILCGIGSLQSIVSDHFGHIPGFSTALETVSSQQIPRCPGFQPCPSVRRSAGLNAHIAQTACYHCPSCGLLHSFGMGAEYNDLLKVLDY